MFYYKVGAEIDYFFEEVKSSLTTDEIIYLQFALKKVGKAGFLQTYTEYISSVLQYIAALPSARKKGRWMKLDLESLAIIKFLSLYHLKLAAFLYNKASQYDENRQQSYREIASELGLLMNQLRDYPSPEWYLEGFDSPWD
jgi:hypothetical protein